MNAHDYSLTIENATVAALAKNYLVKNSTKDKHPCKAINSNLLPTTVPCEFFQN